MVYPGNITNVIDMNCEVVRLHVDFFFGGRNVRCNVIKKEQFFFDMIIMMNAGFHMISFFFAFFSGEKKA